MVLKLLFQGSGSGPVPNRAVVETSSGAQGLSPNSAAQHLWVQTPECLTLNTRTWKLSPQARLLEVNVTSLSYRATKGPWAPTILSVNGLFKPPLEAPSAFGNDESGTCVRRVDGCCGLAQKRAPQQAQRASNPTILNPTIASQVGHSVFPGSKAQSLSSQSG